MIGIAIEAVIFMWMLKMNDFTKEELKEIKDGLRLSLEQPHCDSTWAKDTRALKDKIQSMIENYCEHEWKNHCPECNPLNIYCIKCREYLRENNKIDLSYRCKKCLRIV